MKFAVFTLSSTWTVFLLAILSACYGGGSSREAASSNNKIQNNHGQKPGPASAATAADNDETTDDLAADPCILDDKVTKVKVTVTGKKLKRNDLSAKYLGTSSFKGAIDKLFPNPNDSTVVPVNLVEEEIESKKFAFYHIPLSSQESSEESKVSELGKVTPFKFIFKDKSAAKSFVINHNEGEEIPPIDLQQDPTYNYLFG